MHRLIDQVTGDTVGFSHSTTAPGWLSGRVRVELAGERAVREADEAERRALHAAQERRRRADRRR